MAIEIKAADVMKLRKMTGAGMMDCKKALVDSEGDFERAKEIIKEKGKLVAAKRADRETSEGSVIAKIGEGKAIVVGLGCPCAGYSQPNRAKLLCERNKLFVGGVNGGIVLHKACHCGVVLESALKLGELLCSCDLSLGICLPEGAARNLCHLYVVGYKTGIDLANFLKAFAPQCYNLFHWFYLLFIIIFFTTLL